MVVIDEILINPSVKLVIQTREYGKRKFVDIRKWVKTAKYEGFTKKGVALEPSVIPDLIKVLKKVQKLIKEKKI